MKRPFLLSITVCSVIIISIAQQQQDLFDYEEEVVGNSWYDLQSNAACQNRIYLFDDGTLGAVWTFSLDYYIYADRGTGYNFFNGENWDGLPVERIEADRCGWPSYAPWGETGEIVVAHYSGAAYDGLVFSKRGLHGTGAWMISDFFGPPGHEGLLWPRMVTGGENHNHIYLISLTRPTANGGNIYQGLDGAILYSRSTDGGESWDIQNVALPGIDSTEYYKLNGDSYAWAEPRESNVAFVVGSWEHDLFLMKSTNYGETFEKTLIWDHPYDPVTQTFLADTFYCTDGSLHAAIDMEGMVHVVFGIASVIYDDGDWLRPDTVDGIVYWNETMPAFSDNPNALNPNIHPESELIKDYNLIGWMQDVNGDGQLTLMQEFGMYQARGISTMPQLVIDQANRLFLIYSSITETFENGLQNYRRLWMRSSLDGGITWGQFYHYASDDLAHIFSEFSYPSCAANSDDNIYLIYQLDNEPGLNIYGGGDFYNEQHYRVAKIPKDDIVGISQTKKTIPGLIVFQNQPNPFSDQTIIKIKLDKPSLLKLELYNITGQQVFESTTLGTIGQNAFTVSAGNLYDGVYFYKVSSEEKSVTKKMIVR